MAGAVMYDRSITPMVNAGMDKYGGLVQTQTMIGEDFVSPGLSGALESFYQKAKPADKAKCLELLTAINLQKEIETQQGRCKSPVRSPQLRAQTPGPNSFRETLYTPQPPRPKTAMAVGEEERRKDKVSQVYQTTYNREFHRRQPDVVHAWRPRSTKSSYFASHGLRGHVGETTYNNTFSQHDHNKAKTKQQEHELSRNNPHPNEKFLVWRFPRNSPSPSIPLVGGKYPPEGLTFETMEKVCRGKCRSTYETDYTGMPQGFDFAASGAGLPEDWRSKVPYSLSSSMRTSYQPPDQPQPLQPSVTRYGSNKTKGDVAVGAIPATSTAYLHLKPRTTYDREYVDPVMGHVQDIRDVSKRLGADTLQKQMSLCDKDQRETLNAMIRSMQVPTPPSGHRTRQPVRPVYKGQEFKPSWLSTWTGPM